MGTKEEARERLRNELKEKNKANWFVKHIQKHLDNNEKGLKLYKLSDKPKVVGCAICGKDINQIAEDQMLELEEFMNQSKG